MLMHPRFYLYLILLCDYYTLNVTWNLSQTPVTMKEFKEAVDDIDRMETVDAGLDILLTNVRHSGE